MYLPGFQFGYAVAFMMPFSASSNPDASTFGGILDMATQLLTWALTSMGNVIDFILEHPLMVIFLIFTIVGFSVGLLMRIWHSVG